MFTKNINYISMATMLGYNDLRRNFIFIFSFSISFLLNPIFHESLWASHKNCEQQLDGFTEIPTFETNRYWSTLMLRNRYRKLVVDHITDKGNALNEKIISGYLNMILPLPTYRA